MMNGLMKRLLPLLLAACLLLSSFPALALEGGAGSAVLDALNGEEKAYLSVYADYGEADANGEFDALLVLVYRGGEKTADAASGLTISVLPENGLSIVSGESRYYTDAAIPYGQAAAVPVRLKYEEPKAAVSGALGANLGKVSRPAPKLTVSVDCMDVGSSVYTCTFEPAEDGKTLTVKEETVKVVHPKEAYYEYLREVVVPKIGIATEEERLGESGYGEDFWTNMLKREVSGLLSAAVCDLDMNGSLDMLTVTVTPVDRDTMRRKDIYYSITLTLYQLIDGQVVESDRIDHAVKIADDYQQCFGTIDVKLSEYEGVTNVEALGIFTTGLSYDPNSVTRVSIEDGQFIEYVERPYMNYYTEYGEIHSGPAFYETNRYDTRLPVSERTVGEYITHITYEHYRKIGDEYPYFYQAEDYTGISEILSGEAEETVFDLVNLHAEPLPTATPEEVLAQQQAEANEAAIAAALAPYAGQADDEGFWWGVDTDRSTGKVYEVQIRAERVQSYREVDKQLMAAMYDAILNSGALELTDSQIQALKNVDLSKRCDLEVDNIEFSYLQIPDGTILLMLRFND